MHASILPHNTATHTVSVQPMLRHTARIISSTDVPKGCIKPLTSCLLYLQIVSGLGSCPAAAAEALSSSLEVSQESDFSVCLFFV